MVLRQKKQRFASVIHRVATLGRCCYKTVNMIGLKKLEDHLRDAGLRPTQQRIALAQLLYGQGDRHVCAEQLHAEALKAEVPVSLATVYNTLNQFKSAGLLRELAIEGDRSYFDTNTSNHFHFFDNEKHTLMDIEADGLSVVGMPKLPAGKVIDRIDVIVRLRDKI
jgi:Fur family transcriptional regulator, iron response regulator